MVRLFNVPRGHGVAVGVVGEHCDAHEVAETEDRDEDGEAEVVSAVNGGDEDWLVVMVVGGLVVLVLVVVVVAMVFLGEREFKAVFTLR